MSRSFCIAQLLEAASTRLRSEEKPNAAKLAAKLADRQRVRCNCPACSVPGTKRLAARLTKAPVLALIAATTLCRVFLEVM